MLCVALTLHDFYTGLERIFTQLDEYRRFCHIVRNVYGFEFDITRIELLVNKIDRRYQNIKEELFSFVNLLETIALEN